MKPVVAVPPRFVLAIVAVLAAATASAQTQGGREPGDAMAFIRVVGDLRVTFPRGTRDDVVRKNVEVATGSGFVIAPSGLVLTNAHVVEQEPKELRVEGQEAEVSLESKRIEVAIGPGGSVAVLDGAVVAQDRDLDLAVLQVTAADLPYLPFGDSDAVEAGRPVRVLGFPFGRQVEVGKKAEAGVVPQVTITGGSLSAAREDDEGDRRYLQTDAAVQPGNSGGPMLDEDGYAVGVVRMKLAKAATASGAGFGIPINLVKDFLDMSGLMALMPVARLRPGVVHGLDWKGLRVEMPDGFQDASPARLGVATAETGDGIALRVDRVATSWDRLALEQGLLAGTAIPGFLPAPAAAVRQFDRGRPARRLGSATGTTAEGQALRAEYAVVNLQGEAVVARYLGPPDAVAFNLGLIRRSLETLEAARLLTAEVKQALGPALEGAAFPGRAGGRVVLPQGWSVEPATVSTCGRVPEAEGGLAASPPGDFTVVLRALRWPGRAPQDLAAAVRACSGRSEGYTGRFSRLGVSIDARGTLVQREGETLLLELEAPTAKAGFVADLYDRWVRALGGS